MAEPIRTEDVPHNRLTRLCDTMSKALEADPEYREGDKAIILVDDGDQGGLVSHGYDYDDEVLTRLLGHACAVADANGIALRFHTHG